LLVICLTSLGALAGRAKEAAFPAQKTWLFVAGLLEWKDEGTLGSFPKKNRQDAVMVNLFRKASVPDHQILYIQDKEATLDRLRSSLKAFLQRIPRDAVLVFYYCGHGYSEESGDGKKVVVFAPWDASEKAGGWSMDGVAEQIYEEFHGRRALLLADCCHSGEMVKAVRQLAKTHPDSPSVAAVSSSSARESSTGDWTFTEAFVAALSGRSWTDLDSDGNTTLREFANFASRDMTAFQAQHSTCEIPDSWPGEAALAATSGPRGGRIGERINAHADGAWWKGRVIDENAGKFRVRFVGYFQDDDLWLTAKDLRPLENRRSYAPGTPVDAKWKNKWWPAVVLEEKDGSHLIHYTGYDESWDEWAPDERLRPRQE